MLLDAPLASTPHPVTETGEPVEPRMALPPPLPPTSRVMADFFNELETLVHKYNVRAHEELGLPVPESAKLKSMDDNDTVGKKRRRARKDPNAPK
ncbi:Hypothetical Protein FCC1311_035782 [Hondaea fermentalgiana]|uniref:Uncharacterized protein n=1 Tax=Hondaea fermentalgiana TaxID=2315210 RepID=A0A2R5G8G6_9STRA|nr:Hypothetical Protein FCC1311_035782 [Hondaea fermentalgiana]|eukprot:GBG27356.1 Hypothetical Protein FCC1311_035782 [Hondaea fermentalgiana]